MEENQSREPLLPEDRPEPKRRKRWPTVVAVLIVLLAVAGIVLYDYYVARYARFEPYQRALESIQRDRNAKDQLGEPIRDATSILHLILPSGMIDKDRGQAKLYFKVSGPKGTADVSVQANRVENKWGLTLVEIKPPGGEKIRIEIPKEFAGDVAEPFDPTKGGGGVEPPKRKSPEAASGKSAPEPKQPSAPGPSVDIEIPKL